MHTFEQGGKIAPLICLSSFCCMVTRGVEINSCIDASRCGRGRFCIHAVIDN